MSALPSQEPGLLERHGLTRGEAERFVWVIEPSGRRHAGAAAVARVLHEMGGGWRLLGAAAKLPASGLVYALVARNRGRLSAIWGDPPPYPS